MPQVPRAAIPRVGRPQNFGKAGEKLTPAISLSSLNLDSVWSWGGWKLGGKTAGGRASHTCAFLRVSQKCSEKPSIALFKWWTQVVNGDRFWYQNRTLVPKKSQWETRRNYQQCSGKPWGFQKYKGHWKYLKRAIPWKRNGPMSSEHALCSVVMTAECQLEEKTRKLYVWACRRNEMPCFSPLQRIISWKKAWLAETSILLQIPLLSNWHW